MIINDDSVIQHMNLMMKPLLFCGSCGSLKYNDFPYHLQQPPSNSLPFSFSYFSSPSSFLPSPLFSSSPFLCHLSCTCIYIILCLYYIFGAVDFNLIVPSRIYNCILTQIVLQYPHHRMSTTTNSTKLSQKTLDFKQKYKTERCRYWYQRGFCPFNQFCAFAHAEEELRGKNQLNQHYKTKVCANFKNNGCCKYGDRCQFLHLHEAPLTYNRPQPTILPPAPIIAHAQSQNTPETDEKKHQKELSILSDYGLEVLAIKKGRSQQWRWFLAEGVDPYQAQQFRWDQFQQQFGDYDFKKKPRLGSM